MKEEFIINWNWKIFYSATLGQSNYRVFFSQYHPKRFGVDQVMFGLKLNNQEKWKPQAINFSPGMLKNTLFYYKLLQLMLTSPTRLSINENGIRYYWKLKHFKRSISFFILVEKQYCMIEVGSYLWPVKHPWWSFFAKLLNSFFLEVVSFKVKF